VNSSGSGGHAPSDEIVLARAFAALPMLGSMSRWQLTPLAGGHANRTWRLAAPGSSLVLRVPVEHAHELGVDRAGERAAIEAAAAVGLAPALVYFDDATGLMLTQHLAGRQWSRADAHDPHGVDRLADRLRTLHRLERPARARRLDYATLIADYRRRLDARAGGRQRASATLDAQADRRLERLAAKRRARSLCHNDVHHRNIIEGEALWLIDWEYAAIGDPMYDLASFACYHDLDAAECLHLLAAYAPRDAERLAEPFSDYCWVFDYMHALWLELTSADAAEHRRLLDKLMS
jgi:thiamine kinase